MLKYKIFIQPAHFMLCIRNFSTPPPHPLKRHFRGGGCRWGLKKFRVISTPSVEILFSPLNTTLSLQSFFKKNLISKEQLLFSSDIKSSFLRKTFVFDLFCKQTLSFLTCTIRSGAYPKFRIC